MRITDKEIAEYRVKLIRILLIRIPFIILLVIMVILFIMGYYSNPLVSIYIKQHLTIPVKIWLLLLIILGALARSNRI